MKDALCRRYLSFTLPQFTALGVALGLIVREPRSVIGFAVGTATEIMRLIEVACDTTHRDRTHARAHAPTQHARTHTHTHTHTHLSLIHI